MCRDIWSLHLSLLSSPVPAEPYYYAQEQGKDSQANMHSPIKQNEKAGNASEFRDSDEDEDRSDGGKSSSSSSSAHQTEEDPEMAELLRENSASGSSDDGEEAQKGAAEKGATRKSKKRLRRDESPAGNIAVLVYACWSLRIPVTYSDFLK